MSRRSDRLIICTAVVACVFGAFGIGSFMFAVKNPPALRHAVTTWYIGHDAPGSSGFHLVRELRSEDGLPVALVEGGLEEHGEFGLADFTVPTVIVRERLVCVSTKDFEVDDRFKSFDASPLIDTAFKELASLKDMRTTGTWPPQTTRRTQYTVYWPGLFTLVGMAGALVAVLISVAMFVRRCARTGRLLCPKCRYDRTGLAAGAVCPECGAVPHPSAPT
jgi:hypothetical protein